MSQKTLINIFFLLQILSDLDFNLAYTVEMTIKDEGHLPVISQIEVVDHDNPPFDTDVDERIDSEGKKFDVGERSILGNSEKNPVELYADIDDKYGSNLKQDGVKVSGFLGNVRHKRSLNQRPEGCVRDDDESNVTSRAITVEVGETIHLPCRGCSDDRHEMFESLQWLKLDQYPNSKGLFHIKEIVADLHDEEKLNRVGITLDHTLLLKKAKMSDTGSYFCRQAFKNQDADFMNLRLDWNDLQEYIAKESHMRYYFHVDVIDLIHAETLDVSAYSKTRPLKPEVIPLLNIEITTRWYPWTSCSVCGDYGIMKRMGICVMKKHDSSKTVKEDYLRNILQFSKNSIPCQSQLLRDFQHEPWLQKPNQIQIEECNVPCRTDRKKRGFASLFSKSELKKNETQAEIDKKNAKKKAKKKTVRVDGYFILKCPGISLTKPINWVKGTRLVNIIKIQKFSKNRMTMDMFGNLHFKKAEMSDSGIYSCWKDKKMKFKYQVKVKEDRSAEIKRCTIYLCISFLCDFVVFVGLSLVKFLQRRKQFSRRKKARKSKKDPGEIPTDVKEEEENAKNKSSDSS